jgi:hypothetical protein
MGNVRPYPPSEITAEMREAGVRGVLIYCSDYHSHSIAISGRSEKALVRRCPRAVESNKLAGKVNRHFTA